MSSPEHFTCPHCFTDVRGSSGDSLKCTQCESSFVALRSDIGATDELTLAPLESVSLQPLTPAVEAPNIFSDTLELQSEEKKPDEPCGKCERMIGSDDIQCPHCGYNKRIGRKLDASDFDPYHGTFGFDRYLMTHTQDQNPGGLMLWFHVFIAFCALVVMLVVRSWSLVVGPILIVCYVVYRVHANKTCAFQKGKGVLPKFLLLYNRLNKWKGFTDGATLAGTILSRRSNSFTDNSLAAIEEVEQLQILDIAGSGITDNGIRYLVKFNNLRGLVVTGCEVSHEALNELQQNLPAVCIWRP